MNTPCDTIAAIATPPGDGGIGIIRISGPAALDVAARIFRGRGGRSLGQAPPRQLVLGSIVDPASGSPIDEALAVHLPAGRSYTGESTVEIQGHGGRAVLSAALHAAFRAGARAAGPGEFTKRAFLSGRLDLAQAEAVAELIGAESDAAVRLALAQLQGGVSAAVGPPRERLLELVAAVEATLDLEEEGDTAEAPSGGEIRSLAREILALVAQGRAAAAGANSRVVIAGRPNSGKSLFFNMLLNYERAIVAPTPGTTRDYIAERCTIGGASVTLVDTAGLRTSDDPVEAEGVRRSVRQIAGADLLVVLVDGSRHLDAEDLQLLGELGDRSALVVVSKADLPSRLEIPLLRQAAPHSPVFVVSALTGEGCLPCVQAIADGCRAKTAECGRLGAAPNHRHQDALLRSVRHLESAAEILERQGLPLDLAAEDLKAALEAIDEITGAAANEEVVERIFSRFCVGK